MSFSQISVNRILSLIHICKPIGQDIEDPLPQLRLGGGYDHNYVLNGSGFRRVLSAFAPKTGIRMDCLTDQPGVQFLSLIHIWCRSDQKGWFFPHRFLCI